MPVGQAPGDHARALQRVEYPQQAGLRYAGRQMDIVQRRRRAALQDLQHLQPALEAPDGLGLRHSFARRLHASLRIPLCRNPAFRTAERSIPAGGKGAFFHRRCRSRRRDACRAAAHRMEGAHDEASSVVLPCSECSCCIPAAPLAAQTWPSSTIRIVVPTGSEHTAGHHQPFVANELRRAKAGGSWSRTSRARS